MNVEKLWSLSTTQFLDKMGARRTADLTRLWAATQTADQEVMVADQALTELSTEQFCALVRRVDSYDWLVVALKQIWAAQDSSLLKLLDEHAPFDAIPLARRNRELRAKYPERTDVGRLVKEVAFSKTPYLIEKVLTQYADHLTYRQGRMLHEVLVIHRKSSPDVRAA